MGVWIEMDLSSIIKEIFTVTPLVGVWIEITLKNGGATVGIGHSPCGSVD